MRTLTFVARHAVTAIGTGDLLVVKSSSPNTWEAGCEVLVEKELSKDRL